MYMQHVSCQHYSTLQCYENKIHLWDWARTGLTDLEQGDLGLEGLDDVLLLLDVAPQLLLQVPLRLLLQTRLVFQLGYPSQGLVL